MSVWKMHAGRTRTRCHDSKCRQRHRYMVRGRDSAGKQIAETYDLKSEADHRDQELRGAKRSGTLQQIEDSHQTLAAYGESWLDAADERLMPSTIAGYRSAWKRDVIKQLGKHTLIELCERPKLIDDWRKDRLKSRGSQSVRKTMVMLQSMFTSAWRLKIVPENPIQRIEKPKQVTTRNLLALSASEVAGIRWWFEQRGDHASAALVSLLSLAGLRPGEALALTWGKIGSSAILIDERLSLGEVRAGVKTGVSKKRSVKMTRQLISDLRAYRLASGKPDEDQRLFPGDAGPTWSSNQYKMWQRRTFRGACEVVLIARGEESLEVRPYDLRHHRASMGILCGETPAEVAAGLGHSLSMLFDTYAHTFAEVDPGDRRTFAERVEEARLSWAHVRLVGPYERRGPGHGRNLASELTSRGVVHAKCTQPVNAVVEAG